MSNAAKLKKKAAELEQKRQFDKALALYVQVLDEASEDEQAQEVPLYNRVGDLMVRQGNVAEAVNYYEKAVDLYAEGGFFNNAIALCNKILRQAPGRSSVYYKLGKISAKKGFKSDAKQNFLEYADRMQKEGKMDEAFRALKEFADLVPDQDDVRLMLAEQLSKKGRQAEAVDQLQQLYEKFSTEGRAAEAKATLERMQAIDPDVVPRASGSVQTQKPNDLVFLDVSFDTPVQRPGAAPAGGPRGTVPMPSFEEPAPPRLEGLETTSAADDLAIIESSPDLDLDLGATVGGSDLDRRSSGASLLDGLTPTDFGATGESPAIGGDMIEIERTGLDDEDRAGLRGGLLDLDTPSAASAPLDASEFGALQFDVPEADAPAPPPPHDLALPGHLPMLDAAPEGGDLPLLMPDEGSAAGMGGLDPRDTVATTPRTSGAGGGDAPPLELEDAGSPPRSSGAFQPPRASGGVEPPRVSGAFEPERASGAFEPPPIESSDLPMLDLGTGLGEGPIDISPAELDLAADLGVSPADVPPETDATVLRASDALESFTIAAADGSESAVADGASAADPRRSFGDALIMPDVIEEASAAGAAEGAAAHVDPGAEAGTLPGTDVSPAELDLATDLGVRPIGTPADVRAGDVEAAEADAAAAARTSGAAQRRASTVLVAETVESLRAAAERAPEDWGTRRRFGEALLESGDRDGGMKELELVLIGYERAGDLESARSIADEIIRLDPNSIRHHQKRVEYAFRSSDKSRLVDAYNELADALVRAGQSDKARAVYQRVLGLAPDDIRAQAALSAFVDPAPSSSPARGSQTSMPRPSTEVRGLPPEPAAPAPVAADGDFVNLGDWLREDEGPKSTRMVTDEQEPTGDEQADFADMLKKFKQGVSENVEEEDYASHYDLGVAYKEMGLLDEAISEFQKALRSPDLKVRTYEALGQCFIEKNQFQVATTILGRALSERGVGDDQLVGVLYLLGFANEALQRKGEAISYYQRVFAVDIQFRDVTERLNALERAST